MVYLWDHMYQTPLLSNLLVQTTPPRTRFTALLHVTLPVSRTRYVYDYIYGLMHLHRFHDRYRHTAMLQTSTLPHLIRCRDPRHWHQQFCWSWFLNRFDSRFSIWLASIVVSTWLDSIVFYSIWLMANVFIFDSIHKILIPFQLRSMDPHIGQGVFEILQHWNCGILHNYDNLNCVWQEHSNKIEKSEKRTGKNVSTPHLI